MTIEIKTLWFGAALSAVTILVAGCATADEAPGDAAARDGAAAGAAGPAVEADAEHELACTPLGGHCKTLTECCLGRCVGGRCLKL
jgi:hypothetical protein